MDRPLQKRSGKAWVPMHKWNMIAFTLRQQAAGSASSSRVAELRTADLSRHFGQSFVKAFVMGAGGGARNTG